MDLCEIFDVDEGQEFKIEGSENIFIIHKNTIYCKNKKGRYIEGNIEINDIAGKVITKVIRIELTEDESAIFRNIDPRYKWIAKDIDGNMRIFEEKPMNKYGYWYSTSNSISIKIFNNILKKFKWNMGPLPIDEYVDRGEIL